MQQVSMITLILDNYLNSQPLSFNYWRFNSFSNNLIEMASALSSLVYQRVWRLYLQPL
jgi:hypothetical protein